MQTDKQNKKPLLSGWKGLNEDIEKNQDKRSKTSKTSRTSQRSTLSQSQRMKRIDQYKKAVNSSESTFYSWIQCAKYLNVIGAFLSFIYLSWMSLLIWIPLIYLCSIYQKGTDENIEKI